MLNRQRKIREYFRLAAIACLLLPLFAEAATQVGKWKRFEVAYANSTYSGNPFDLELYGTFTHTATGRTVRQLGFYAGNNTWKIFFMPDREGEWTFVTQSPDADLNNKAGSLSCVASGHPGPLVPAGNRWKLGDSGKFDVPIMIPTRQWFKSTTTGNGIQEFINWADNTVGARVIGTTLVYFTHPQDAVPYLKGSEGDEFNIAMWDRLNSHYDAMRDKGIGLYIMFYSDDGESPNRWGIGEKSAEEIRLLRYAVARFSAYPTVIWDTGIDIHETRSDSWIDWFADWLNQNDPWRHPVGSRFFSSFGKQPNSGTFWSDGLVQPPSHSVWVDEWKSRSVPTIFTDRWREDYGHGNFNRDKIRYAVWEMGLVGGSGAYVSGNENGGYLTDTYASDFKAAPDVGYMTKFIRNEVQDFGRLSPHDELITAGSGILSAQPGHEYVAYLKSGGSVSLDLRDASGKSLNARWYNPRTGQLQSLGSISGGSTHSFNAPDSQDWVLHVVSGDVAPVDNVAPASPGQLNIQ
jgi:hypothetical protein